MDQEKKKEKLREYLVCRGRLERKCEEARRWRSLAQGAEPDLSNRLKVTVMEIDAECEALAGRTQRARGQLMAALEGLEDSRLRELLEAYYVEGKTTDQICRERGWSRRYVLRLRGEAIRKVFGQVQKSAEKC